MTCLPWNVVLCVLAVTFIGTEYTKLTFQNLDLTRENHYLHNRVDQLKSVQEALVTRLQECEDASDHNTKEREDAYDYIIKRWSEYPRADSREEFSGVSTAVQLYTAPPSTAVQLYTAPPSTAVALVTQPNAGATQDEPRFHTEYCVVTEGILSDGEAACLLASACVITFLYGLSVLKNTHLQAENLRLVRLHEDLQDESRMLRDENVTLSTKNLKLQILLVLQTVTLVGVITAWMASSFVTK